MALAERVKAILSSPKTEWPLIAAEPTDIPSLYTSYIVPLAAIGPICGFLGMSAIDRHYGFTAGFAFRLYLSMYISNLVGVALMGFIVSKLAPRFGASENLTAGVKLMAYSATASWIGGVFLLLPVLSIIAALMGLYSLYLFFLGLPVVMRTSESNALPYAALSIGAAIVIYIVLYALKSALLPGPGFM